MCKPVVALVGRPNVGKSTIFNRMVGSRMSVIEDTPGVTRDRIYGTVNYNDEIKGQAELAIDEADVVVFVVDGKEGLTSNDYVVKDILMRSGKDVIVAINKADTKQFKEHQYDFYELGFEQYSSLSGEQNFGIYDLLDEITKDFKEVSEENEEGIIKFSIIGRPNVGKSSILNHLLQENKAIVTDIAGTTRDIVEGELELKGIRLKFIDTAGIRKTEDVVERIGVDKSLEMIKEADLVIHVLNNNEELTNEDKEIQEKIKGKTKITFINKSDLESKIAIKNDYITGNTMSDNGLDNLKNKIIELFDLEKLEQSNLEIVSSTRAINLIKEALKHIDNAINNISNEIPVDMIAIDIKAAWDALGEITGESYQDELLDTLFSKFCLGK